MTKEIKAHSKYVGVFPFQFDDDGDEGSDGGSAIPTVIHLIPIGQWEHDLYGPILITAGDIREFAQNFNAKVRKGVYVTAGHEGFQELPAQGWITQVETRDTGLWGTVEWNDLGMETLADKQYKFFSPEFYRDYEDPQTHQIYRNVITGGALTKSPYFKELEAIVFSEPKFKNKFNDINTMDLKDILAKELSTLTDEEKAFVKEHAAELTDEQKASHTSIIDDGADAGKGEGEGEGAAESDEAKAEREAKEAGDAHEAAGLNRDGSEKVDASEKVTMSALEFSVLKKQADQGAQAFRELEAAKLKSAVNALTFTESNKAGKFLPKSADKLRAFMEKLSAEQRLAFSTLVGELPKSQLFAEVGADAGAVDGTAQAEVDAKIKVKLDASEKAGKAMKYSDALKEVMSENEGLETRYDSELPSAKKKGNE